MTKPIRKLVTLSPDTWQRVEAIRVNDGIGTISETMLRLIVAGLAGKKRRKPNAPPAAP